MFDEQSMRALNWLQDQRAIIVLYGDKATLRVYYGEGREWFMESVDLGELLCLAYEDLYVRPALAEADKGERE